ncbi:uncharacterized protein LOC109118577 isoform X1 [Fukomys damarensis]|uniref:uncharacterized protein LOC109118577 isoform X1 n=1 Tax=Fukomys damarensis TaxID=885580 RepID=UPI0008FF4289|nr:uncharacterized protein LOC109118577 isoform X1 [Fukomys damarensis]XP_033621811.1 uncharacterized protein LOC109118577 isoform X1 [Fukomys damarensis]
MELFLSSLQCFRVLFLCIFKRRGCLPSPHCAVPLEATDALPLLHLQQYLPPLEVLVSGQPGRPVLLRVTWVLQVYDRDQALSLDSRGLVLLGSLTHNAIFNYHWESLQGSCQTLLADCKGLAPALKTLPACPGHGLLKGLMLGPTPCGRTLWTTCWPTVSPGGGVQAATCGIGLGHHRRGRGLTHSCWPVLFCFVLRIELGSLRGTTEPNPCPLPIHSYLDPFRGQHRPEPKGLSHLP